MVEARGLLQNWKQPVFFGYDCKLSKQLMLNIITRLENVGYHVIAVVSDFGGSNRGLWKDLNICETQPFFFKSSDH